MLKLACLLSKQGTNMCNTFLQSKKDISDDFVVGNTTN
jgi:hypothetical protein